MKKLLLTLGAVASVAAPVAAVVACGSTTISKAEAEKNADEMLTKIQKDTGYKLSSDDAQKIVDFFIAKGGDYDFKIKTKLIGTSPSTDTRGTHGSNDFMYIISGGKEEKLTTDDGFGLVGKQHAKAGDDTLYYAGEYGIGYSSLQKETVKNWGTTKENVSSGDFFIFLQTNKANVATYEVGTIGNYEGTDVIFDSSTNIQELTDDAKKVATDPDHINIDPLILKRIQSFKNINGSATYTAPSITPGLAGTLSIATKVTSTLDDSAIANITESQVKAAGSFGELKTLFGGDTNFPASIKDGTDYTWDASKAELTVPGVAGGDAKIFHIAKA